MLLLPVIVVTVSVGDGRLCALRREELATLIMRRVIPPTSVTRNVNNVHISPPAMKPRLVHTPRYARPGPYVSHLSAVLSTYEQCSTAEINVKEALSQGL